jgi:universal stress protein A
MKSQLRRILCPIDFSECSKTALAKAEEMAKEASAKLYVVFVDASGPTIPPGRIGYAPERDGHRRLIEEATPSDPGIDFELHYLRGQPIDEIRRFAALREIDLMVMGTHGRTGLAKLMMGSVAEQMSNDSPCEVVMTPLAVACDQDLIT